MSIRFEVVNHDTGGVAGVIVDGRPDDDVSRDSAITQPRLGLVQCVDVARHAIDQHNQAIGVGVPPAGLRTWQEGTDGAYIEHYITAISDQDSAYLVNTPG